MRKVIIATVVTVFLLGGILMLDRYVRINRTASPQNPGEVKTLPSDVQLTDFTSKQNVTLKKYAGKVVLVNFWASWCEACMAEMPSIQKLYSQLKSEGLEVIAINVDENPSAVVPKIVNAMHLTFPIFTEVDGGMSKAFDVVAIPFSVVAGRDHKIVRTESGELDWSTPAVVSDIRKLLKSI